MLDGMQHVHVKRGARIVHVETELGVVNIHLGLRDARGRRVERVSLVGHVYSGESVVRQIGARLVELKKKG